MDRFVNRLLWVAALAVLAHPALAASTGYHTVDRISGPDGGWDYLSVDTVNNRVLVARGDKIMSVDLATKAVNGAFAAAAGSHAALAVNGGKQVLITNGRTDTVSFVDAKTGAVVGTAPTGKNPDAATVDPSTGLILVMNHTGGDITLVDPRTMKATGQIPIGGTLEAAAVDGTGKAYVNVEDKAEIVAVDIKARKVLRHYQLNGCEGPTGIAYAPADKLLITTCDGVAQVVNPAHGTLVSRIQIGPGADGVAFDPKQKLAFVSSGGDGTLSIISISGGKGKLVDTVPTQTRARTIALDPRSGRVYLPAVASAPPAAPGGRPSSVPGSFVLLSVGK